jgi:hypothetical protein
MFSNSAIRVGALTMWVTSSLMGVAGAQVAPPRGQRTFYCTSGLFTLVAGTSKFNVSLDAREFDIPTVVVMRLINHEGVVEKWRQVRLRPGASATLEFTGAGMFRVQAESFDNQVASPGGRRTVVGLVELFDDFRAEIPVQCAAEPEGPGRIPG